MQMFLKMPFTSIIMNNFQQYEHCQPKCRPQWSQWSIRPLFRPSKHWWNSDRANFMTFKIAMDLVEVNVRVHFPQSDRERLIILIHNFDGSYLQTGNDGLHLQLQNLYTDNFINSIIVLMHPSCRLCYILPSVSLSSVNMGWTWRLRINERKSKKCLFTMLVICLKV